MNLKELKEAIDRLVSEEGAEVLELKVMTEYDYGDRSHTRALTTCQNVQVIVPRETAYSDSGLAIPDPFEEDAEGVERVVVIGDYV